MRPIALLLLPLVLGVAACGSDNVPDTSLDAGPPVAARFVNVNLVAAPAPESAEGVAEWDLKFGSMPADVVVGFSTDRGDHQVYRGTGEDLPGFRTAFANNQPLRLRYALTRIRGTEILQQVELMAGDDTRDAVETATPELAEAHLHRWELQVGSGAFRIGGFLPVPPDLPGPSATPVDFLGAPRSPADAGEIHRFGDRVILARRDRMEDGQAWSFWVRFEGA